MTYSLWLSPGIEEARGLARCIRSLARLHGTPVFVPHVTLLGGIRMPRQEVVHWTARLAAQLEPLRLRMSRVSVGRTYFRRLVVEVSEGAALAAARRAALRALAPAPRGGPRRKARSGEARRRRFRPHLSLLYGANRISLTRQEAAALKRRIGQRIVARRLLLVRTGTVPSRWRVLIARPLRGSRRPGRKLRS